MSYTTGKEINLNATFAHKWMIIHLWDMEAKTDKQQCGEKCWKKIGDLANIIKIGSKCVISRGKQRLRQMHLNCCDER